MSLAEKRLAIRNILDPRSPADAAADYYANYHPEDKVQITIIPDLSDRAEGYLCSAMTGMDLFRPLVTMRLPQDDSRDQLNYSQSVELFHKSVPVGAPIIISTPARYRHLLGALFDIEKEDRLRILILDQKRYKPIINVLVTRTETSTGLPRYIVRKTEQGMSGHSGDILASAGLNWRSPRFAEIYVHTRDNFRRMGLGRSVVAALIQNVIETGRTPIYVVSENNEPSTHLAKSVGFVDTGFVELLIEGSLRERPVSASQ